MERNAGGKPAQKAGVDLHIHFLINCDAKLKPEFCGACAGSIRQQERRKNRQLQKAFDKKLNYSQQVLNLLEAGYLGPADLPGSNFPGSDKYLALFPEKFENGIQQLLDSSGSFSEFEVLQEGDNLLEDQFSLEDFSTKEELPEGWASFDQKFLENADTAHGGAFGPDGLPAGDDLIDLPYSWDHVFSQFDKDTYKKFNPIKWGKCGEERREAIKLVLGNNIKNFGYTVDSKDENGKRHFISKNKEIYEQILDLFDDYKERTSKECLVMLPKKDPLGLPVLLPNANRFNDESKKTTMRIRFENLFQDAGKKFKAAVLLTLTTNQKWHRNIFEANKRIPI